MTDPDIIDRQQQQWRRTFAGNPDMYGTHASEPGRYAIALFTRERVHEILELGAGQGRDTLAFLASGFEVTAVDYEDEALRIVQDQATALGVTDRLRVVTHDVRHPLSQPDESFDAVYSHMLFNMALTTREIGALAREVRRVLRPGGLHVYTVRHVGDPHSGTGIDRGDGMYEHGGFIVHFFDGRLVERLDEGFAIVDFHDFEEGELPRRLWRITLRKE